MQSEVEKMNAAIVKHGEECKKLKSVSAKIDQDLKQEDVDALTHFFTDEEKQREQSVVEWLNSNSFHSHPPSS